MIGKCSKDFAMNRDLTIESLLLIMGLNGLAGARLMIASGWTSPMWLLVGAIALCLMMLQDAIDEDWFI